MNIEEKQQILEDLIEFLDENKIDKNNIDYPEKDELLQNYLKDNQLILAEFIPGVYFITRIGEIIHRVGKLIYHNGKNGGWGFKTGEFSLQKVEEGSIKQISDELNVTEVNTEIPEKLNKVDSKDKDFEDFLYLYTPAIDDKFTQEYGDIEDKELWNDLAKEMFLKSKYYVLKGDEVKPEKIEESKKLNEEYYKDFSDKSEVGEDLYNIGKEVWKEFWTQRSDVYNIMVDSHNNGTKPNREYEALIKTDWAEKIKKQYNLNEKDFRALMWNIYLWWDKNVYSAFKESKELNEVTPKAQKVSFLTFRVAEEMYNSEHEDKWQDLDDDTKADYYNAHYPTIFKLAKQRAETENKQESKKLNEVKDTDFIVYANTAEGPLYLSGIASTTFQKDKAVRYPTEKEAEEALAQYRHNVVDYDNFKFKVARLNESKKITESTLTYTYEVYIDGLIPLMFTDDTSVNDAKKEYIENEGKGHTVEEVKVKYYNEPKIEVIEESKDMKTHLINQFKQASSDVKYNETTGQYDDSYDKYLYYKQKLLDLGMSEDDIEDLEENKSIKTESFGSEKMLTWEDWIEIQYQNEVQKEIDNNYKEIDVDHTPETEIEQLDNEVFEKVRDKMYAEEDTYKQKYKEYIQNYINNAEDYIKQLKIQHKEVKQEASFKDKVKAIKKSLKDRDGRLSDKTAEEQATKIAGSMIKNEVKQNGEDVYPPYTFTKDDREYIQGLLGDSVDVKLNDYQIELKLRPTRFISSGIINFTDELYKEIEEYVLAQYPEAELSLNNTGDIIWLRRKTPKGSDKVHQTLESKKVTENISPLTDIEKTNYYYATVKSSIPYNVYKIDDKFYDGNGLEIDNEEINTLQFFTESKNIKDEIDEILTNFDNQYNISDYPKEVQNLYYFLEGILKNKSLKTEDEELYENKKLNEKLNKGDLINYFVNYEMVRDCVSNNESIEPDIINEFFTEVFYDIKSEEDMNESNDAEKIIRKAVDIYNSKIHNIDVKEPEGEVKSVYEMILNSESTES